MVIGLIGILEDERYRERWERAKLFGCASENQKFVSFPFLKKLFPES